MPRVEADAIGNYDFVNVLETGGTGYITTTSTAAFETYRLGGGPAYGAVSFHFQSEVLTATDTLTVTAYGSIEANRCSSVTRWYALYEYDMISTGTYSGGTPALTEVSLAHVYTVIGNGSLHRSIPLHGTRCVYFTLETSNVVTVSDTFTPYMNVALLDWTS